MDQYCFFLFVNPTSGGNRAGVYTQLHAESIKFTLKQICIVEIYNLFEKENIARGMLRLKEMQKEMKTRAIVCGGDGTVMWVVEELVKNQVDLTQCPIGIIPFGTGNDFSRVLGWGGDTDGDMGKCLGNLRAQIQDWVDAVVEDFDIWDVHLYAANNGFFRKIKKVEGGFIKEEMKQNESLQLVIRKKMSNYFSFGVDARIGYGFDKNRTQSACCNKVVYACEGFKKMFLSNPTTNDVLESMEIMKDGQGNVAENQTNEVLFKTIQRENAAQHIYQLKGNPVTLLCVNIPSYSGGAGNIWQAAQGQVGLVGKDISDKFHPQIFGDGEVEFVTFNSIVGMANERFLHGQAQRVAQGKGPFLFRFRQTKGQQPINQYVQIDGEFYHAVNPSHVIVKQSEDVPNSKIKVLVKKDFRVP